MSTVITRTSKGAELLFSELDANFENLNNDKLEVSVFNDHASVLSVDQHPATAISFYDPVYVSENVSDAISETYAFIGQHANTVTDAHDATAISYAGSSNLAATTVEAALDELDTEKVAKAGDSMSGVLQIAGTGTPTGSGMELHLISSEGYVQAYNRTGAAWLNLLLRGLAVQLYASGAHKGGVDGNGMYGVAMQKAGAPDTTEITAGVWRVVKNTSDGTVKLYYNDGGTLKSVALA